MQAVVGLYWVQMTLVEGEALWLKVPLVEAALVALDPALVADELVARGQDQGYLLVWAEVLGHLAWVAAVPVSDQSGREQPLLWSQLKQGLLSHYEELANLEAVAMHWLGCQYYAPTPPRHQPQAQTTIHAARLRRGRPNNTKAPSSRSEDQFAYTLPDCGWCCSARRCQLWFPPCLYPSRL